MTRLTAASIQDQFTNAKVLDDQNLQCKCPLHEGVGNTSLNIKITDEGNVIGHCFGGCDDKDVYQHLCEMGFNENTKTKTKKPKEKYRKLDFVPPKAIPLWQDMMTELHKKGLQLHKTLFVYRTLKEKNNKNICVACRIDKKDGDKDFFFKSLAINNETKEIEVINKGPNEPKPLYHSYTDGKLDVIDTLHVYEGEKTTERGKHLFKDRENILHVCWGFGAGSWKKADWKSLEIFKFKEIVLFPDNDKSGYEAMEGVAQTLYNLGHRVINVLNFESFPNKWDIADITNIEDHNKFIEVYSNPKAAEVVEPKEYAYIRQPDLFYGAHNGLMYKPSHFSRILRSESYTVPGEQQKETISNYNEFLDCPVASKFDRLAFEPSKAKKFIVRNETFLNSYIPHYIRPLDENIEPLLQLLKLWFPDDVDGGRGEEYRWWFTAWLAHNIQFPGVKILSAPIIVSPEGYGKGALFRLMQKILGIEYVKEITQTQLESQFNPYVFRKLLLFFDELRVSGSARIDIMNKIKFLITEPEVNYNDKLKLQTDIKNTFNVCCYSNHRTAISLKPDARRWFAHFVENQGSPEFFEMLHVWIKNKSGAAMKYLSEFDLKEFKPNIKPPLTEFFYEICEDTQRLDFSYLDNAWNAERFPKFPGCDILCPAHVVESTKPILPKNITLSENGVIQWCRERGFKSLGQHRYKGSKESFWDTSKQERELTADNIRQEYREPFTKYFDGTYETKFKNIENNVFDVETLREEVHPY